MKFEDFQRYFSCSRTERYLLATNGHEENAINLYKANLKICQAFYPLLSVVEIGIRNELDIVLRKHFSDAD